MALQLRRTSVTKVRVISTLIAVFALIVQPMYGFVASQVANAASGSDVYTVSSLADADCSDLLCNSLQSAIDAATDGDLIQIKTNLSIHSQVTIDKAVIIDGSGRTLWGEFSKTSFSNNAVIGLQASATIRNLTINGKNKKDLHGINAWHTKGAATVSGVTLLNMSNSGMVVGEHAHVVANSLTTRGNGWNAINVDKAGAFLELGANNNFSEGEKVPAIYFDKWDSAKVSFGYEYEYDHVNRFVKSGDRAYFPNKNPIMFSNVVLNGQNVLGADITNANCDAVSASRVYYSGGHLDLSATILPYTQAGSVVSSVTFKVRKQSAAGCTSTSAYQSGVVAMVAKDGNKWTTPAGSASKLGGMIDGELYTAMVDITDAAGNKSTKYVNFVADTESPKVDVKIQDAVNGFAKGVVTIVGTVDDENPKNSYMTITGPDNYIVKSDGKAKEWKEHSYAWNTAGLRGEYTIEFEARDKADNKTNRSVKKIRVTVDNDLPAEPTIVAQNVTDNVIKGNQQFLVTAEQGAALSVEWDHGVLIPGADGIYTLDTSMLPYGTEVTVTAKAKDAAGNESPVAKEVYIVQNNGPMISDVSVSSDRPSFEHIVSGMVSPAIGTSVLVTVNGQAYLATVNADGTWSAKIDVTDYAAGRYSFAVLAVDQFDNPTETAASHTFDVPAPTTEQLSSPQSSRISMDVFTAPNTVVTPVDANAASEEGILGARDDKSQPAETMAVIAPSAQGWKLFGIAWFWWVLMGALIAMIWWWIVAARRRSQEA